MLIAIHSETNCNLDIQNRVNYPLPPLVMPMHSSAKFLSPTFAVFHCSCDKVYHKQEVRFLLYLLG